MTASLRKNEGTLVVKSRPDEVTRVRAWVADKAQAADFSTEDITALKLAVSEACSNVIRHAYEGADDKDIIIAINIEGDSLSLTITDFGRKFDLSRYKPPDLDNPSEGGYGVYLIRELMDEVEYDNSPPEGTVLRMVRRKGGAL
jgi:serine/threonine-protein kinase RsbW